MFIVKLKPPSSAFQKRLIHITSCCSQKAKYVYPNPADDFTKVPQYPPIEPVDEDYKKKKDTLLWHDKIKRQKTVEEKIFEINMPRYYGWKCLLVREGEIPFDSLEFTKFITRTHLIETNELPLSYGDSAAKCEELTKSIKNNIKDTLIDANQQVKHKCKQRNLDDQTAEREATKIIVNELNRVILKLIQRNHSDLQTAQIDYSPRIESFWYNGSLTETYEPEYFHFGRMVEENIPEEYLGRPSDKYIQYIGKPIIQLRCEKPLPSLVDKEHSLYLEYPVPVYKYDPFVVFGSEMVRRHVTSIPGFWPGEPREFSLLSFHDSSHVKYRPETYGEEDLKEAVQCQAIYASFGWLMSLISYQGFNCFNDVTYPFVTQTVLTNGREFNFAVYQLTTAELFHEDPLFNPKCNICWITPKMELFNTQNEEISAVNDDVIKMLLQMYTKKPEELEKHIRKPYLDKNVGLVANYEDDEKRQWIEEHYKHFSSNRPRHRTDLMYELDDYERIFKIEHWKMIRDARKRPYELNQNPYLKRMDEHKPKYIPRAIRPDAELPKYKQRKFEKTYYPK